jgi:hypothetical protein
VLHGDPLIGRKLVNNPVSLEPPDPTILLATKGIVRQITDRLIVDMGHACLHLKRKGSPAIFIPRDHGSGQPRVGIVGDPQGDGFIVHLPKSTPSRCTARSRPNVNQEMPPKNSGLWNWIETSTPQAEEREPDQCPCRPRFHQGGMNQRLVRHIFVSQIKAFMSGARP